MKKKSYKKKVGKKRKASSDDDGEKFAASAASQGPSKSGVNHAMKGKSQAKEEEEEEGTIGVTIQLKNRATGSVHLFSISFSV